MRMSIKHIGKKSKNSLLKLIFNLITILIEGKPRDNLLHSVFLFLSFFLFL